MAIKREEKTNIHSPDFVPPDKPKKVHETVNLTNIDDSALSIAYFTYKVIRKYNPNQHVLHISYLDWVHPIREKSKRELLSALFKDYDPPWEIDIVKHQPARVEVVYKFPGLNYLIFGV